MSIHSGISTLGPGGGTVETTTTLYDLMEAMGEQISSFFIARIPRTGKKRPDPTQDRMIARKVAGMFMSGRIKFKRPGDIRKTYPEWFE